MRSRRFWVRLLPVGAFLAALLMALALAGSDAAIERHERRLAALLAALTGRRAGR